jgi:hypothetical protein
MKIPLIVAGLQFSSGLFAQNIVVLSKGDTLTVESGTTGVQQSDPTKAAFLNAFKADLARQPELKTSLELSDLPQWGRKVPGAEGTIQFHDSFRGGFVVRVGLGGLTPNHKYILTLNGNPERAGNDNLVDPVPGNEKEKYFDFITMTTDSAGRYRAVFGILLPAGPYDLRFYVKDTDDFKIVLYRDFFKFSVK